MLKRCWGSWGWKFEGLHVFPLRHRHDCTSSCKGETRKACENRLRQYKIDIGVCKDTLSCYLRKVLEMWAIAATDSTTVIASKGS
eukprot:686899-Hanusia_phi.AAC.4